jgi:hypothetical protein
MKRITYLFIVLTTVLVSSCSDSFLDTKSPSQQSTENVFKSVFFTEAAIEGLYSVTIESTVYAQKISTNWPTNSDIEFAGLITGQANLTANGDGAVSNYYCTKNSTTTSWDNIYRLAKMSTTAAIGIRKSPLLATSDSTLMKAYLGEALTLRALAYFELVKLWGDVPFRVSTTTIDNAYSAKTDRDSIYKYIINDLIEAQNYLPWQGKTIDGVSYTSERVTKGFAKGLAARIALFAGGWSLRDANLFPYQTSSLLHHPDIKEMNGYFVGRVKNYKEYYAIAAQQCAEIIGNKDNPHKLDDFESVWKSVCQLKSNAANENLYEVAFGVGQNGDIGTLIGVNLGAGTTYGPKGMGGGNVKSNAYYFYSFDSLDVRRDLTLSNISYTATGYYPPSASAGKEGETMSGDPSTGGWNFAKWRYNWMTSTYMAGYATATARLATGINWIVMRYSDVLLMFAEAENELTAAPDALNETAGISARTALETVRARAFKSRPERVKMYASDFFEAIVNERAWEFGGEGLRKYDLVRWGLLSSKIEAQKKAMCLLVNGNRDVTIFDKYYSAGTLPVMLYYKYVSGSNLIDRNSINWYTTPISTPDPTVYKSLTWLSGNVGAKGVVAKAVQILVSSSGLNASYNYSDFLQEMDSTNAIQSGLNVYSLGNGVCNYRHPFAIQYTEIQNANGAFQNSFGY